MRNVRTFGMLVLAIAACRTSAVQAEVIPIVEAAQINGSPWMPVENLFNGHGFDQDGTGNTYDPGISFADTQWRVHMNERTAGVYLIFDLGGVSEIGSADIWNYYEGGPGSDGRSTKHIEISYSNDNVDYTSLGVKELLQQPSPGYDQSSLHTSIPIDVEAQYVKFSFAGEPGDLNYGDVNWWGLNEVRFNTPAELLAGDYNSDGAVDSADYTVWRDKLGTTDVLPNDPIGGEIGSAQYDQWKSNFSGPGGGSLLASAVPEPATLWLMAFCWIALCQNRRRTIVS